MAPGTVIVISTIGMPPLQTASAARCASRAEEARTTGTMPMSRIRWWTSCLFTMRCSLSRLSYTFHSKYLAISARDASAYSFHHLHDFLEGDHGCVPRCRHRQRSVGRAALDRPLRIL